MGLTLRAALLTDRGLRRANNEDAAFAGRRLLAVADGVGGAPAGELASELAISALSPLDEEPEPADPLAALRDAFDTATARIRAAAAADPARVGMGTTVTAVLVYGHRIGLLHVGDSRCYLFRDAAVTRLTRDDTLVQEMVERGLLTTVAARDHPQRSLVTQVMQGQPIRPAGSAPAVRPGDRLLLCSDGLTDVLADDMIAEVLGRHAEPADCADELVALVHRGGAPDNVTVVIADVQTPT